MAISGFRISKVKEREIPVVDGYWSEFDFGKSNMTVDEFKKMAELMRSVGMHSQADVYINEMVAKHNNPDDYDINTGKVIPGTQSAIAREFLEGVGMQDLYHPLLAPLKLKEKLNANEFPTEYAAKVLSQIPGVKNNGHEGHDYFIEYDGRTRKLTGGSGGTGMTGRKAVDKVLYDLIVARDLESKRIEPHHEEKRREILKNAVYDR